VAWLIDGNDPARWIQEIALWLVETSSLQLCVLAEAVIPVGMEGFAASS